MWIRLLLGNNRGMIGIYWGLVESVTSLFVFEQQHQAAPKHVSYFHLGHSQPYWWTDSHFSQCNELLSWLNFQNILVTITENLHPKLQKLTYHFLVDTRLLIWETSETWMRKKWEGRPLLAQAQEVVESLAPHGPSTTVTHGVRATSTSALRVVVPREQWRGEQDDAVLCSPALRCLRSGRACPQKSHDILQDSNLLPDHRRELVRDIVRCRCADHEASQTLWHHRSRWCIGSSCFSRSAVLSFSWCTYACLGLILKT